MEKNYKKITMRFTPHQLKQLKKEKEATGNSTASIVRRAVNQYFWKD